MEMEQTDYSEASAYKIQTPGNFPEESIQHTEHGESFKSNLNCFGIPKQDEIIFYYLHILQFDLKQTQ
jgi:hypothetical protein